MAEVGTNNEFDEKQQANATNDGTAEFVIEASAQPLAQLFLAPVVNEVPIPKLLNKDKIFGQEFDVLDNFVITKGSENQPSNNIFINSLHLCFMHHLPIILRPDDLWLQILQGLSIHISENKKELQTSIVNFSDPNKKIKIIVNNNSLIANNVNTSNNNNNNDNNDEAKEKEKLLNNNNINWKKVLNSFDTGCRELCSTNNKDEKTLFDWGLCDFSTSNQITKVASQCCLFSVMANYVEFICRTRSGIPKIILKGTLNDWKLLEEKCKNINNYKTDFWYPSLMKVMEKIVKSVELLNSGKFNNNENKEELIKFWDSIYRYGNKSGGPTVTGWCNVLCPYLFVKNDHIGYVKNYSVDDLDGSGWGTRPNTYASSFTKAPLLWDYFGNKIHCDMVGGIVGIQQNPNDGSIANIIGWMIKEDGAQNKQQQQQQQQQEQQQ